MIRESDGMTLQAASDQYGVSTSTLSTWRQKEERLQERLLSDKENVPCRLKGGGRRTKITDATAQELLQYLD